MKDRGDMGKFIMTLTEADGEAEAPGVGRGGRAWCLA